MSGETLALVGFVLLVGVLIWLNVRKRSLDRKEAELRMLSLRQQQSAIENLKQATIRETEDYKTRKEAYDAKWKRDQKNRGNVVDLRTPPKQ